MHLENLYFKAHKRICRRHALIISPASKYLALTLVSSCALLLSLSRSFQQRWAWTVRVTRGEASGCICDGWDPCLLSLCVREQKETDRTQWREGTSNIKPLRCLPAAWVQSRAPSLLFLSLSQPAFAAALQRNTKLLTSEQLIPS